MTWPWLTVIVCVFVLLIGGMRWIVVLNRKIEQFKHELHTMIRDNARDLRIKDLEIANLRSESQMQISALTREIANIKDRWTVTSVVNELQDRYIKVLEQSHHEHEIPLPPKPELFKTRTEREPSNFRQHLDLDLVDEAMATRALRDYESLVNPQPELKDW